jgi:hypothetical protein
MHGHGLAMLDAQFSAVSFVNWLMSCDVDCEKGQNSIPGRTAHDVTRIASEMKLTAANLT